MPGVDAKMPGKRERFTICHLDNLVLVNLCPSLSGSRSDPTSCYQYFRTLQSNRAKALKDLLDAIAAKLKLTQAGVVIDRMELMTSLIGSDDTLKLVKMIKHGPVTTDKKKTDSLFYPFFGHIDFSMIPTAQFDTKLTKLQNGFCRLEQIKFTQKTELFQAHMYTSVVKSGCRFIDEHCILEKQPTMPFIFYKTTALGFQSPEDAESLTEAQA